MKNFILGSLTAIVALVSGALGYLALGLAPVGADMDPSSWEASLMTTAVHASVQRRAPAVENPLPRSDGTLIAGGKLYMNDCVGCHGGPAQPPSDFGATFSPRVPQFAEVGSQYSEAQLFWVAKHGVRMSGMYPQSPAYSDSQLWSLAAFIHRIRDLPPGVADALRPAAANALGR